MENKNNRWIDPNVELPPIGVYVTILYPNPAYNDLDVTTIAYRNSKNNFTTLSYVKSNAKYGFKLPIKKDKNVMLGSYVKGWKY